MKNGSFLTAAVVLAAMLTGCQQAAPPAAVVTDTRDADAKAIRDVEAAWVQAFATKDFDKMVSNYTEETSLLMPGMPAMTGLTAIKQGMRPMVDDPNFSGTFASTKVEVAKSGDLAYSQGNYTFTMSDAKKKKVTEQGKYVTVYKKQADGSWKAIEDINNADGPAK